jgi:hypothetical protein
VEFRVRRGEHNLLAGRPGEVSEQELELQDGGVIQYADQIES